MVLGKLPVPGRPTIWITVGQGPTALAVGAGGGCSDIFTLIYSFFPLSPSLWETARYRLKYCHKGPLNPKPNNQPNVCFPENRASCPRSYKTFSMLNSAEHEILNAHKYKKISRNSTFLGLDKPRMLFFLLKKVKMPTIVGILTVMSRKILCSAELCMKKVY